MTAKSLGPLSGGSNENTRTVLRVTILSLIAAAAVASRLFSVILDPWFNFRATKYLVANGFYKFWDWFDDRTWHPLGRVTGGTLYPGLMVTSGAIYHALRALTVPVDIRNICVLLAPAFSGLTAYAAYLLTNEMTTSPSAGLLAAIFMGIAPGYISRSVAGSYDNEAIAIFLLVFTFFLWIKALKLGSMLWGALCALFYGYMVASWGGYAFITNMLPLHALTLILMGRYSARLYVSYTTWYALGTLASMQIPFVGFLPVKTSEHMPALGVFGFLQLVAFIDYVRGAIPSRQFQTFVYTFLAATFGVALAGLVALTSFGYIAPWGGRFYSLWDTGYAKIHIPIIASVSEHQPTAWPAFFFDLNMLVWLFPAGVYLCFQNLRDEHVFIVVYALFGTYFAGVMVRLMLTLTPVVCVAAAIAASQILDTYLVAKSPNPEDYKPEDAIEGAPKKTGKGGLKSTSKPVIGIYTFLSKAVVVGGMSVFLLLFVLHCTWVTSNAYSSPSVVLASRLPDGSQHIIDDYREAYQWLRQNTKEDAKIMSWWDYGYQIGGMADRPTLVDNNTWNNTHIATVGKAMSSREEVSYPIMRQHEVDYVLVVFGGLLGYSGDDINKFLWMVRIAEGIWPEEVQERKFFTPRGEYRVDDQATETMKNSLMYKMSYYNYNSLFPAGQAQDRVRGVRLPDVGPTLDTVEEAFTSENWIIRIYKVKDLDNIGRDHTAASAFERGQKKKKPTKKRGPRILRVDFIHRTCHVDDGYQSQDRLTEEPRRRRIRSSRASSRLKTSYQPDPSHSDPRAALSRHFSDCIDGSDEDTGISSGFSSSPVTRNRSRFQLTPESQFVVHLDEATHSYSEATCRNSEMIIGSVPHVRVSASLSRHDEHQSSSILEDTRDDKSSQNNTPHDWESVIPVHLDDNTDGYYCCGCGIRRSDEHHRARKFTAGDPAWRNFCRPCHAKHLASGDDRTMKAYGNFCFGCGFARSSHFNKAHPIKRGQKPVKNFCAHCMKRVSRKAYIPTETLLGSSSDESDSEWSGPHLDEAFRIRRVPAKDASPPAFHQNEAMKMNFDSSDCAEETDSTSAYRSPSKSVGERLRTRRSARASDSTPLKEDQTSSECLIINRHEDNSEDTPKMSMKYRAPDVTDGPIQVSHQATNDDNAPDIGNLIRTHNSLTAKRSNDPPATPKAPTTARNGGFDMGSSLLTSDSNSPSKRATFNERVEVRTSPTYWQREHCEGDGHYAHFRHEHYHEELREGQKAVPLKDPLKDPEGHSARQIRMPRFSVDEESFNSWSVPGAGWNAFIASDLGSSSFPDTSGGSQSCSSTAYVTDGYNLADDSVFQNGAYGSGKARSNPCNRPYQSRNGNDSSCGQGKENQPCPASPIAPERPHTSFGSPDGRRDSEKNRWTNQSPQHDAPHNEQRDGPCASHAGSSWGPEVSNSYHASRSAHPDGHFDIYSNLFRDYRDHKYTPFIDEVSPKDQRVSSGDPNVQRCSFDPRYTQPDHQRTSSKQWDYNDTRDSDIQEDFKEPPPRSYHSFPDHSADQDLNSEYNISNDTDIPFDFSSTSNNPTQKPMPKLPFVGCAMEIPDDMSDSDVHNLLIPGCDDYIPWHGISST
ncbi:Dolichyl-diphosphooligosaccharide--protein glycosyltransferase subunit stt3 [Colletotrichum tanaceti]|nr:Dolichyl-diphosphooligosaccharide--protein glycosyltransferase subunit stt3 [Colletotrichum tanaceti]